MGGGCVKTEQKHEPEATRETMKATRYAGVTLLVGFACMALAHAQTAAPSGTLLISLSGEHKVALVDPASGEARAFFPAGKGPHEITLTRDAATAFVAIPGTGPQGEPGNTITVIDLKSRSVKATFTLAGCGQPHDTRVSRDGSVLWVACAPAQAVLELDARTGELRRTLKTARDGGWFVEATPDSRKLYVPHLEGKALTVIEVASGEARAVFSGSTQFGVAIAPDGREAWASDADEGKLTIVDTATDEVRGSVSLGPKDEGRPSFSRLRFTPDGKHVAVVLGTQFMLIDAKRRAIVWTLEMPHAGKVVTVSPDSRFAAISHPSNDSVSVIDLAARNVRSTFFVGKTPDGVAWVP